MNFEVKVTQYRETSYNIGYLQGGEISGTTMKKFSIMEKDSFDIEGLKDIFKHFAPHLLDEIKGLADGLGMPFKRAASFFSGYDIPKIEMGCSSAVNKNVAVRNYDFSPELYDHRFVLSKPNECFASIGSSLHRLGRHEGVNEKGLFISLHFVNNANTKVGLSATTIVRIVLDTCRNTKEAIALLRQLPHSWSYNFSIGDCEGETAIVEATPFEVEVRSDHMTLICTNHFQHQAMEDKNRVDYTDSFSRIKQLSNKNLGSLSVIEVFDWFKNPESAIFYNDYKRFFGTLHTFAYDFSNGVVLIALPFGDTLEIDWNSWLQGSNISTRCLKGELIQKSSFKE